MFALYQEALGSLSPEQVVAVECGDELLGFGLSQGINFWLRCAFPNHSVDAAVLPVPVGVYMRVALTALGGVAAAADAWGGVMLDDKVVPVSNPEVTIRADFGDDW